MGRFKALAEVWGVTERQAELIADTAGPWMAKRVDTALSQPERAAGRFASSAARPIGAGLKTGGVAVAGGATVYGGSQAYKSYTERQTAQEENEIDKRRADAIASVLNDPTRSDKEKKSLIRTLENTGFFDDTDKSAKSWMQKLGITQGSLNPVSFFGGGLSGVLAFLVIAWMVVRIVQSGGS